MSEAEGKRAEQTGSRLFGKVSLNSKKGRVIVAVSCAAVAVVCVAVAIIIAAAVSAPDRQTLPQENSVSFNDTVQGELSQYLCTQLSLAADCTKTKLSITTEVEIPEQSVSVQADDPALEDTIKLISSELAKSLDAYYHDYDGSFGEEFTYRLPDIELTSDMLSTQSVLEGRLGDGFVYSIPDDGDIAALDSEGRITDKASYATIELVPFGSEFFEALDSRLFSSFDMQVSESIIAQMSSDFASMLRINDIAVDCTDFRITAGVRYLEDKLDYMTCTRGYTVTARVSFTGDYADIGDAVVSFKYIARQAYDFTWAGVYVRDDVVWLEKGETYTPDVSVVANGDVQLAWTVTEGDFVTVDGDGKVHADGVNSAPCLVTVTMTYLGNTYTDSYKLYSRVPVEGVSLSASRKTVPQGSIFVLKPEFKPAKATVRKVYWFSCDESIAAVDKNGNVTALKAGNTRIYMITLDGNFKAVCDVTIS